ncbi:MAG: DUF6206 family protein [Deltaproteobacteria bacterium]|nr:DUF6206 family protein [Kofleriaceae bacterium]
MTDDELAALDRAVEEALASGDASHLHVLGYGEISSVLACETARGTVAVKRLPPFPDAARFRAYRALVDDYVAALAARGITAVATEVRAVERAGGALVAYHVQPLLPADRMLPRLLAGLGEAEAAALFERVVASICAFVDAGHGLDAQLSNWLLDGDRLAYLDLSTPLLRDAAGADRLDRGVFMASLPWLLRPLAARFLLDDILAKYFDRRGVLLDLLGNLHKERLAHLVAPFLEVIGDRVTPAIDAAEVARYYRQDARSWALLQRLRRLDRAWQRRVRRRPYPFLLPGRIAR